MPACQRTPTTSWRHRIHRSVWTHGPCGHAKRDPPGTVSYVGWITRVGRAWAERDTLTGELKHRPPESEPRGGGRSDGATRGGHLPNQLLGLETAQRDSRSPWPDRRSPEVDSTERRPDLVRASSECPVCQQGRWLSDSRTGARVGETKRNRSTLAKQPVHVRTPEYLIELPLLIEIAIPLLFSSDSASCIRSCRDEGLGVFQVRRQSSTTAVVSGLFVYPSHGRRGYGSALLSAAERVVNSWGVARVVLRSTISAVALYRRRGYVPDPATKPGPPELDAEFPMQRCLVAEPKSRGKDTGSGG